MKKIILYEYDKRNREDFLKQLEDAGYAFLSIMVGEDIKNVFGEITTATKGFIMDVTPFFRDDERSLSFALVVEKIIEKNTFEATIIDEFTPDVLAVPR